MAGALGLAHLTGGAYASGRHPRVSLDDVGGGSHTWRTTVRFSVRLFSGQQVESDGRDPVDPGGEQVSEVLTVEGLRHHTQPDEVDGEEHRITASGCPAWPGFLGSSSIV